MADPTDMKIQLNAAQIKLAILEQENERLRQGERDAAAQVSSFMRLIETMKLEASTHLEMITLLQAKIGALERESAGLRANARHSDERLSELSEAKSALEIRARNAEEAHLKLQKQSQELLAFASNADTELQSYKRRMAAIHEASVATRQSHRRALDRFKSAFTDTLGSFELCSSVLDDMSDLSSSTYRVSTDVPPAAPGRVPATASVPVSLESFLAASSGASESKRDAHASLAPDAAAPVESSVNASDVKEDGETKGPGAGAGAGGTSTDQPQLASPVRPLNGLPSPSDTAEALDKLLGRDLGSSMASSAQSMEVHKGPSSHGHEGGAATQATSTTVDGSPTRGRRRSPSPTLERMYSKSSNSGAGTSTASTSVGQQRVVAHSSRASPSGLSSAHSSPNASPGKAGARPLRSPSPQMERHTGSSSAPPAGHGHGKGSTSVTGAGPLPSAFERKLEEMGKEEATKSSSMRVVARDWKPPEPDVQDHGVAVAAGSGARAAKASKQHAGTR